MAYTVAPCRLPAWPPTLLLLLLLQGLGGAQLLGGRSMSGLAQGNSIGARGDPLTLQRLQQQHQAQGNPLQGGLGNVMRLSDNDGGGGFMEVRVHVCGLGWVGLGWCT